VPWWLDLLGVSGLLRADFESMAPVDSRADEGALPAMFGVRAPAPGAPALSRIAMVGELTRERKPWMQRPNRF